MFKSIFAAALVALAALGVSTPALADGISEDELNRPLIEKIKRFEQGLPIWFGDKRNGSSMTRNPLTRVTVTDYFGRQHGHGENPHDRVYTCTNIDDSKTGAERIIFIDGEACPAAKAAFATFTTSQVNGNATLGRALAATIPGVVQAFAVQGASKLFGTYCGANGGCGDRNTFTVSSGSTATGTGNASAEVKDVNANANVQDVNANSSAITGPVTNAAGSSSRLDATLPAGGTGTCPSTGACPTTGGNGQVLNPNPH